MYTLRKAGTLSLPARVDLERQAREVYSALGKAYADRTRWLNELEVTYTDKTCYFSGFISVELYGKLENITEVTIILIMAGTLKTRGATCTIEGGHVHGVIHEVYRGSD